MKENVTNVALLAVNVSLVIINRFEHLGKELRHKTVFSQILRKTKKLTGEPEGPEDPRGPIGP